VSREPVMRAGVTDVAWRRGGQQRGKVRRSAKEKQDRWQVSPNADMPHYMYQGCTECSDRCAQSIVLPQERTAGEGYWTLCGLSVTERGAGSILGSGMTYPEAVARPYREDACAYMWKDRERQDKRGRKCIQKRQAERRAQVGARLANTYRECDDEHSTNKDKRYARLGCNLSFQATETCAWEPKHREPIEGDQMEGLHDALVPRGHPHAKALRHEPHDLEVASARFHLG
jgi:hypothetical protein